MTGQALPKFLFLTGCWLCLMGTVSGGPQLTLQQILDQVELRGQNLESMTAEIRQRKWTDILGEFDEGERGRFLFLRASQSVYLRKDILKPQPNHLVIADGKLLLYQPVIRQAQRHHLGENKNRAEFLLLGFGSSRESLENAYVIELLGQESVESQITYVLKLVPKSDRVSAYFSEIILWFDAELWVPIQQKLIEPTHDYLLVNFEEVKLNPKLSKADFAIDLPKNVQIVGGNR